MPSRRRISVSVVLVAASLASSIPLGLPSPDFDYNCLQPKVTTDPETWSTEEFLREHLPNPMFPTPIFWSGVIQEGNQTISVRSFAEKCGKNNLIHGATVGQIMCNYNLNVKPDEKEFVMPANDAPASGIVLWDLASKLFAEYTKGEAFVTTGSTKATSIWFGTEWPSLKANEAVTIVTGIEPTTCLKKCYWYCQDTMAGCNGLPPCSVSVDNL